MIKQDIINWFSSWIKTLEKPEIDDSEELLMSIATSVDFMKEAVKLLEGIIMTTAYVYLHSYTHGCYTVGFYDPSGKWQPESDWPTSEQAAQRVHYLNGGNKK